MNLRLLFFADLPLTGDCLFPGGVGRTTNPTEFDSLMDDLESRDFRVYGEETLARTLIVDTSSMDDYAQARAFYRRQGLVEEARIRNFYGPGDDKVTFWKSRCDF